MVAKKGYSKDDCCDWIQGEGHIVEKGVKAQNVVTDGELLFNTKKRSIASYRLQLQN